LGGAQFCLRRVCERRAARPSRTGRLDHECARVSAHGALRARGRLGHATEEGQQMTQTAPTKFEQTHISMVLDRSGSMESCRKATIDAVNKYLLEARQDSVLKESDFELLTFDTDSIDSLRRGAPVAVKDISMEDYVPRGGTPLYDAIGRGID